MARTGTPIARHGGCWAAAVAEEDDWSKCVSANIAKALQVETDLLLFRVFLDLRHGTAFDP